MYQAIDGFYTLEPGNPGLYMEDLPGSGTQVGLSSFMIDNIRTTNSID
jgi:hypothetical protein